MVVPERSKQVLSDAHWTVRALARLWLSIALILGVVIIVGGRDRWSSPGYRNALDYPYAPTSWGIALCLIAAVGLVGALTHRLRLTAGGLVALAVWCIFFAFSFWNVARNNPLAGTTGIPIYLGTAVTALVLAVGHWRNA